MVYTILPIIYDVAIKNNIRPERPMAASSIGAQMGIIASPVSVAVVSLVAMLGNVTFDGKHLEFLDLLSITIPSTLLGILAIGIFSWFRGKDLDKDEAFQKFISVPENRQYVYGDTATLLDKTAEQLAGDVDLPGGDCRGRSPGRGLRLTSNLRRQTVVDGAGHSDVYAADRGAHYHPDQNQSCVYLKKRSFSFRYDCDCRGIRDRLDGGNHVRRAYVGNSGRAGRNGQEYPWAYAIVLLLVSKFVNSQAAALAAIVPSRWLSVSIRRISWPLRRHVMATISCRPTQAIWRRFSLTVPAQPVLAASSLTTASFCRV